MAPDRKFIVWIVLRRDTSVGPHSTLVPRYSTGWSGIGDGLTRYSPMRADELPIGDNAVLIDLWRGRLVLGRPSKVKRLAWWIDVTFANTCRCPANRWPSVIDDPYSTCSFDWVGDQTQIGTGLASWQWIGWIGVADRLCYVQFILCWD